MHRKTWWQKPGLRHAVVTGVGDIVVVNGLRYQRLTGANGQSLTGANGQFLYGRIA